MDQPTETLALRRHEDGTEVLDLVELEERATKARRSQLVEQCSHCNEKKMLAKQVLQRGSGLGLG